MVLTAEVGSVGVTCFVVSWPVTLAARRGSWPAPSTARQGLGMAKS